MPGFIEIFLTGILGVIGGLICIESCFGIERVTTCKGTSHLIELGILRPREIEKRKAMWR